MLRSQTLPGGGRHYILRGPQAMGVGVGELLSCESGTLRWLSREPWWLSGAEAKNRKNTL
ncbi:MAG: hypothetical protein K0M63_05775 [Weeksellaceae bacterium]|nr:hypothetical protein [Weeksellaceae bacterium]